MSFSVQITVSGLKFDSDVALIRDLMKEGRISVTQFAPYSESHNKRGGVP